ncbi:MAG TPA: hypothetical protein VMR28_00280 [Candidatus Saccharimonadales bacterium]|nr:hypothetical protein [Candidatus Saccharimonadales bacterium]
MNPSSQPESEETSMYVFDPDQNLVPTPQTYEETLGLARAFNIKLAMLRMAIWEGKVSSDSLKSATNSADTYEIAGEHYLRQAQVLREGQRTD